MLLRKLYFNRFKRKIENAWKENTIPEELQIEYKKYLPIIMKHYKNATHWHGTGRYHYDTNGKSKYEESMKLTKIIDSFKQILDEGKLKVYDDPWAVSNNIYGSSISTTQWRMYARVYAELHMHESAKLTPIFGDRKNIVRFITDFSLLASPPIALFKMLKMAFISKKLATKGPTWFRTINSEIKSKGNAISDLIYIVGECSSNINDNYAILFGINGQNLKPAKVNPILMMLEERFTEDIPLDLITHIEVPIRYVDNTKEILKQKNINIEIIPLEFCEMYQAEQGIKFRNELARNILPSYKYKDLITHYKKSNP